MSIQSTPYGTHALTGQPVDCYTLTNANGLRCCILTYGGIVSELHTPDREGKFADIVLGMRSLAEYEAGHPYYGAIIGRTSGRVTHGKITIDGQAYTLPLSQAPNHLHGGFNGFDKKIWSATPGTTADGDPTLKLNYLSCDGEEGYPGNLQLEVCYTLNADNTLRIDYIGQTDRPTLCAPTNHSYFNLRGDAATTVHDYELELNAAHFVPADEDKTLQGTLKPVIAELNDFRTAMSLGNPIARGLHTHGDLFRLDPKQDGELKSFARLHDPISGRTLITSTTESYVQLYTGEYLFQETGLGKHRQRPDAFTGVCLECQGYPGTEHDDTLSSPILRPGETYRQTTIYAFSTED